jgi:hypothetical protein
MGYLSAKARCECELASQICRNRNPASEEDSKRTGHRRSARSTRANRGWSACLISLPHLQWIIMAIPVC